MSLIPDALSETLSELMLTYKQIEAIKFEKRLNDAKLSLYDINTPSLMQDAQAKAGSTNTIAQQPMSDTMKIALGAGALLAVYLIVK
jgi:hypothetical protein